ncbi:MULTISPECIES: hypothetical protein [unclassified Oceanispirochaeta]|uniref:hypothetical protein n=1 Tax=unclassified Oceanispirochaeta TaxID=2635722 RepID=UPI000E09A46F|nr:MULTISPECIES: hypothetical protein [unclassified Oceanispirochaeta]MBF9018961.1 hypothetical protein [Oceanispirochaeta sp. M2]NPD75447.1 hypothetical protein [Oceanispirochaeta sp. M1]RDG28697.1 hypothetical protein DV872_25470 [Oceanispirochaeta sp. M1]
MPIAKNTDQSDRTMDKFKGIADAAEKNNRANEKPGKKKTRRNIFIFDNHWSILQSMSEEEGVTASDLVRRAIKEFIEKS